MAGPGGLLGGRYQLDERLGSGGMAEVYRGRDLRLGRAVAVKALRSELAEDATFRRRFQREAESSAALNHPGIVAVHDSGDERDPTGAHVLFIVMELVDGQTLRHVLSAQGQLDTARAVRITVDMCAALDFSHQHGIIHRDIKPGNVMITSSGQVKVMDFGIALALSGSAITPVGAVVGTALYLSPEQANGAPVDARSDVYAIGCVLYELLCGQPPFVADNPVAVAYRHIQEPPRPPRERRPDIPPGLSDAVLRALAKDPADRPQSAGELRQDLLRFLTAGPGSTTGDLDALRQSVPARVEALRQLVDTVAATEEAATAARAVALDKIANPGLGPAPDRGAQLRARLARLVRQMDDHPRWRALAEDVTSLEREASEALSVSRDAESAATGLLARRDELRGRVNAYRARAIRLGRGEDIELSARYRHARDLLWRAPCDLPAATLAVLRYQQGIRSEEESR